jgi:molybdenum-dependent DNA-binding transcriptional regulator ModE
VSPPQANPPVIDENNGMKLSGFMQLDLIDLRLFLQVAEAGSITHGARHAHLALAAASTRIRNLESLFGVPSGRDQAQFREGG